MNILITYFSQTGNTKKVATTILECLLKEGHSIDLKRIQDTELSADSEYDVIFIGSACHSSDLAQPVKQFLHTLEVPNSCVVVGFVTHATVEPTGEWANKCLNTYIKECYLKNITFKGYFSCLGKPSPAIEEFIHSSVIPDKSHFQAYLKLVRNHPDKNDLRHAKLFAKEVIASLDSDGVIILFKKYLFSRDPVP